MSVPAGDRLLRFGHQIILVNTWTHSAPYTGEKSQISCCLATGIPHLSGEVNELTATGTILIRPTFRSAFIIQK